MKRKFSLWIVVLVVVMAGVLAACDGGRTGTPLPIQPSPTAVSTPPPPGGEEMPLPTQPPPTTVSTPPPPGGEETPLPSPSPSPSPVPTSGPAPVADGATLLRERCTLCHNLERVESARKSAEEWERTVSRMIGRGARLTAEEKTILVEYLATHYR